MSGLEIMSFSLIIYAYRHKNIKVISNHMSNVFRCNLWVSICLVKQIRADSRKLKEDLE